MIMTRHSIEENRGKAHNSHDAEENHNIILIIIINVTDRLTDIEDKQFVVVA